MCQNTNQCQKIWSKAHRTTERNRPNLKLELEILTLLSEMVWPSRQEVNKDIEDRTSEHYTQ